MQCAEAGGKLIISCIEPERSTTRTNARVQAIAEQRQRREDKVRPRWIWVRLEVNDIIATIGANWIFDNTESALAICEDLLLERSGTNVQAHSHDVIAGSGLFEGLTRRQIAELGKFTQRHRFDAGDIVFRQGETGDRAYFLVGGQMDVLIDIPGSSRKHRVSVFSASTLFGEMALIDGSPRSATVSAARRSVCVSIDAKTLETLQDQKSELILVLMRNLSRQLAGRLRIANNMIAELEH